VTYETVQIVHDGRNKSDYDEQAETAMGDYNKCANRNITAQLIEELEVSEVWKGL